jgi:hypothetical protein
MGTSTGVQDSYGLNNKQYDHKIRQGRAIVKCGETELELNTQSPYRVVMLTSGLPDTIMYVYAWRIP